MSNLRGFSLVELLVAVVVAMVGTLAIFQTLSTNESYRRTTASGNDAIVGGGLGSHVVEHHVSWAGSGLTRIPGAWGCPLAISRAGVARLPSAAAFPIPFDRLGTALRLAPIIASDGGGAVPDQLVVMAGASGVAYAPIPVFGAPSAAALSLQSTLGVLQNDLLLAFDPDSPGAPCTIVQATSPVGAPTPPATVGAMANPIRIDGAMFTPSGGLAGYSAATMVTNLGADPRILAFGIGVDPATRLGPSLLVFDVLTGAAPAAIADNIVNLQVAYGIAADASSSVVANWVHPTGAWSYASLSDGSPGSADRIARLRALRLAVVARSTNFERTNVNGGAPLTLFADEPTLRMVLPLAGEDGNYRYKVSDTVVALRNTLLANN